jgi:hypothetical protein
MYIYIHLSLKFIMDDSVILGGEGANMVPVTSNIKPRHPKQSKLQGNSPIWHWKIDVQNKTKNCFSQFNLERFYTQIWIIITK